MIKWTCFGCNDSCELEAAHYNAPTDGICPAARHLDAHGDLLPPHETPCMWVPLEEEQGDKKIDWPGEYRIQDVCEYLVQNWEYIEKIDAVKTLVKLGFGWLPSDIIKAWYRVYKKAD